MKITPKKIILFILIAPGILFTIAYIGFITMYTVSPYFETVYAPNYDAGKFKQITLKMTEQEVLTKLGEPIQKNETEYEPKKIWYYSKGKNSDANYFARAITFLNGAVIQITEETYYD